MEFVFNNMGKIIGVMAVLVVLALVGGMLTTVTGADQNAAKDNADKWAKELGAEVVGISCAKNDSDGDGYVSCTVRTKDNNIQQIECAKLITFNTGCRLPKFRVNQTQ